MNPELLPGTLAPDNTEAETAPPAPLRLVDAARRSPSAEVWRSALPPLLAARLPKALRTGHERLVARWEEAAVEARTARLEAERAHEADNTATREAVAAGKRPPAATEPALRAAADEADRVAQTHAVMVRESGTKLVQALDETDLADVIAQAQGEAAAIVEGELPAAIEAALAVLARAGAATEQAAWTGVLAEKRRQGPWRGFRNTPGSPALAGAREALERSLEMVRVELEARHRRAQPAQHHAPSAAVQVDEWPEQRL
jgi:hypothetical protein